MIPTGQTPRKQGRCQLTPAYVTEAGDGHLRRLSVQLTRLLTRSIWLIYRQNGLPRRLRKLREQVVEEHNRLEAVCQT